jgi:hypothetical protein
LDALRTDHQKVSSVHCYVLHYSHGVLVICSES